MITRTNAETLVDVCSLGMPALLSSVPYKSKVLSQVMSCYKTNKDVSGEERLSELSLLCSEPAVSKL